MGGGPCVAKTGLFHLIRFNAEVLMPEVRSAGKTLEVITYPGETTPTIHHEDTKTPRITKWPRPKNPFQQAKDYSSSSGAARPKTWRFFASSRLCGGFYLVRTIRRVRPGVS